MALSYLNGNVSLNDDDLPDPALPWHWLTIWRFWQHKRVEEFVTRLLCTIYWQNQECGCWKLRPKIIYQLLLEHFLNCYSQLQLYHWSQPQHPSDHQQSYSIACCCQSRRYARLIQMWEIYGSQSATIVYHNRTVAIMFKRPLIVSYIYECVIIEFVSVQYGRRRYCYTIVMQS